MRTSRSEQARDTSVILLGMKRPAARQIRADCPSKLCRLLGTAGVFLLFASAWLHAGPLECDLTDYEPTDGLRAEMLDGDLFLEWSGADANQLRATFGVDEGQPVVRQLAALSRAGHWAPLAGDARPEFYVAEGQRRISQQQLNPMADLGREATPDIVESEKWRVFWDAPLNLSLIHI